VDLFQSPPPPLWWWSVALCGGFDVFVLFFAFCSCSGW
ncbi:hypothetical protein A2U01_0099263, partial [Trifolium medium]|nr:hypothetical protein [Trifolium medium]